MRFRSFLSFYMIFLSIYFAYVVPGIGQYREYHVYGKVVDSNNQPIPKVEIILRDIKTSRRYKIDTDKEGNYKLVGLPHGIYKITIKKDGYKTETDEWNFQTPQERIQKVEMQTIVMMTEEQIKKVQRAKQAQADFNQATERLSQGDIDGAIIILEKMIRDNPEDANAHYILGISYLRKRMLPEAIAALTKTTELSPSFAGAYHQLGLCYQQQEELDEALKYYMKALELKPNSVDSLYNGGLILFKQNRIAEALTYFEKALELRPDDPGFLEMAGRCLIHQGDYARAIEYLEKAKDACSDEGKIKFLDELITKLEEQIRK